MNTNLLRVGIGIFIGVALLAAFALPLPAGSAAGVGALQTASPAATPPTPTPRPPTPTPTATPRKGGLTVNPSSAAAGAQIMVSGTGFSANAILTLSIEEDASNTTVAYVQPKVDGSGAFTQQFATTEMQPGTYTVMAYAMPNTDRLSEAKFTITGMPGLPNTGSGGTPGPFSPAHTALAGLGIALLALIGLGIRRRLM